MALDPLTWQALAKVQVQIAEARKAAAAEARQAMEVDIHRAREEYRLAQQAAEQNAELRMLKKPNAKQVRARARTRRRRAR
eukprot:4810426-Prymnesium_polylepis.1